MTNDKSLNDAVLNGTVLALAINSAALSRKVAAILNTEPLPKEIKRGMSAYQTFTIDLPKADIEAIIKALKDIDGPVSSKIIGECTIIWMITEWTRVAKLC